MPLTRNATCLDPQEEMRGYFRNISAVMDCVGCEKCRLWGKLQTLGLATALKVCLALQACLSRVVLTTSASRRLFSRMTRGLCQT